MMTQSHAQPRRSFLAASLGTAVVAALGAPTAARAQTVKLRWANLAPGFTTLMTNFMVAKGIDKANGLDLGKPTVYTAVTTYTNDFVAGNYDVCINSWDVFAARYLVGVPLQFVCPLTTANMINIVTPASGATSIGALAGKLVAAPQSAGTYRMMRALLREVEGFDIETATRIQNVDNPAASITLVMANRADAALSWEPNVSGGLKRVPDMKVLYNAGVGYRKKFGVDLPYFGVAVRREVAARHPQLAMRLSKAFAECVSGIEANVDDAVAVAAPDSGISAEVWKTAIASGRLQLKHAAMADETGKQSMRVAANLMARNGLLPRTLDDGFFAA